MNRKFIVMVVVMLLLAFGTAMATEFEPMAFQYLRSGNIAMQDTGNNSLYLYGETVAKQVVSRVEVTIVLQQFKNGVWVDIWSDCLIRHNTSRVTIDRSVSVPKGYSYRLYGIHNVTHNGISETTYTQTGSIYIN